MGCVMGTASSTPLELDQKKPHPRRLSTIIEESSFMETTKSVKGSSPMPSEHSSARLNPIQPPKPFTINPEKV